MFVSYREIIRALTGVDPIEKASEMSEVSVKHTLFCRGYEEILCLWSCVSNPVNLELKFPAQQVLEIKDIGFNFKGETFLQKKGYDLSRVHSGRFSYKITLNPYQFRIVTILKNTEEIFHLSPRYLSGESPIAVEVKKVSSNKVKVQIENKTRKDITVEVNFGDNIDQFSLSACQKKTLIYILPGFWSMFKVSYCLPGGEMQEVMEKRGIIHRDILCYHTNTNIKIDGDLSEFENAFPVELKDKMGKKVAIGYTLWDEENLYFAVEVYDERFCQPYSGRNIWKGDSVQVSLDLGNEKTLGNYDDNDYEFGFALIPESGEVAYCWHAGEGGQTGERRDIKVSIRRLNGITVYEAAFPWRNFSSFIPTAGNKIGFNFLVNDNDGEGRSYTQLTPGIGEGKHPYFYCGLLLLGETTN